MGSDSYDVVVAGGGPGGSALACLVAMQGHRVLLLEKEKFPRYQIGESLLPSTINGVCSLIGVSGELARAGFVRKQGGTFRWGASPAPWTFSFAVSPRMANETSFAYQVERMKFDHILLNRARSLGVEVREECTVTDVVGRSGRIVGARYITADGQECEAFGRYVVAASGNKSALYQRSHGTREYSEFFRGLAIFGYYNGGERLPAPNSGNILCVAFDSGWFWYIPLSDTLTSVGAVVRRELAGKIQGSPEEAMRNLIAECPMIADYLSGAQRVSHGVYGKLRIRKDYSYHHSQFWQPGFILVGDAACFVDPVFSSGVHLATYGALLAARSVNSVLAGAMDENTAFTEFQRRYRREYRVFYEFLMSFYDMHTAEYSYFWSAKKVTRSIYPELESFVDLVGGISSGEAALSGAESAARLKEHSAEFAEAVEKVSKDKKKSMAPLFKSPLVRQAMLAGAQLQAHASLGEDTPAQTPLFEGGLIPSRDGMRWEVPR